MTTLSNLKHDYAFKGNAVIFVNGDGDITIEQWGPDIYTRNHSKDSLEYELNLLDPDLRLNVHYFVFLKVLSNGDVDIVEKVKIND